ncbi:GDNF family receptor alpha-3 [Ascaphus truei]|uniref:GDNF family receptor alpha-3 n=1 Tax=Ascaphus truei TaxID=8439 RepID=UPI003F592F1A
MRSLGIVLLIAGAVGFLSALAPVLTDCIEAEQHCLEDSLCNSSYRIFEHCSHGATLGQVDESECREAALGLQHSSLLHCKCQRRMRREEHCLKIYWTVHPVYVQGYLDLDISPYEDEALELLGTTDYTRLAALVSDSDLSIDPANACLNVANICSLNKKCSRHKNSYVYHCRDKQNSDGSCDRRKCHRYVRHFFEKVPEEFTKRLLFCPCQESHCAERRRKTIVPECSFQEKSKQNCLQLFDSCIKDNICKSRLADFQKHCHLLDKTPKGCPVEQHGPCLQSYMRMIGTTMTPNYINNSSMDMSLWCTCEGSGNQQEECKRILGMFTSNRCLKNAILSELSHNKELPLDAILTISKSFQQNDTDVPVLSQTDQVENKHKIRQYEENVGDFMVHTKMSSSSASGVSCPSLALTLLSPTLLPWLLQLVYLM